MGEAITTLGPYSLVDLLAAFPWV